MDWSDSWRGAFRIELRAQAIGLACRGWQVMPGTYPAGSQWTDGVDIVAQDGPSPLHADWAERIGAQPDEVAEWWNGGPYSLLVATGTVLDVIEVGADLGRRTTEVLRANGLPVPIAATPNGRWMFLTHAGQRLHTTLAEHTDVVLHGTGSWIPLPPTAFLHGIVHWRVRPEVCGWNLPDSRVVQRAMIQALDTVPFVDTVDAVSTDQRLAVA